MSKLPRINSRPIGRPGRIEVGTIYLPLQRPDESVREAVINRASAGEKVTAADVNKIKVNWRKGWDLKRDFLKFVHISGRV